MSNRLAALCVLAVLVTVFVVPVAAISIVPLTQAGTPFNASVYAQDTPQSDPMVFQCYWDGTGRVYLSGDQFSVTGIYADDGYTITVQPSGSVYDAPVHTAGLHAIIELTDGMRPGMNTFTLVVRNWQGLSMSYGTVSGMDYQTPYIVQVIDSPVSIVPLGPAGTPFDSYKYAQDTPQSDPMYFHCYWDGTGRVYISGDKSSVTGIYADDGYTITVQPGGSVYDASDHRACQHPVIELTDGMHPGLNTFTLVVRNWQGLSMSYGKWPGSNQTPYIVQVNDSTTVTGIRPASGQWGKLILTNITGNGFASGARVFLTKAGSNPINATNISVVSPTGITCTFRIPVYVPIGAWNVGVRNPDGTAGTKVNAFMVRTPSPPTVTAITPSSGTQGTTVQISYLAGTGFALTPKPTIQLVRDGKTINATNITVINPNRITCTFRILADANPGMWTVRVRNADSQSGTKTEAFVVRAPPTLQAVSPASGIRGTVVDITNVSGTGFVPGARVYLTRAGNRTISATNVSVTSLERITCTVAIPPGAGIGPWNITVKNPDGKSGMKTDAFMVKTVLPPTVTDITPPFGIRGTTIQISHLAGTRFALIPKPTVQLVKNTRAINATNVTVVNPNRITCTFVLSPYTMIGPWDVKVINADMQYGVKSGAFSVNT